MKNPEKGDMVRVELGGIYHFGIYVSDEEVIQFGLAPSRRALLKDSEVEVLSSDIDTFLAGGFLEVCEFDRKERKKNRAPDEVVNYARSKLGMRGYSIIYNNCEHFANECINGVAVSRQADFVRELIRSMPIVDIYLAMLPEGDIADDISCELRRKEIASVTNERVKREKYFAWKLLEYALQRSFGLKISDLEFTRNENGGYKTDRAEFSISHSKGALAVAVSRNAVGIDIEPSNTDHSEATARRVMNESEFAEFISLPEAERQGYFVKAWTAKEALFKASQKKGFNPSEEDTLSGGFVSIEKQIGEKIFTLSVATAHPEKLRFFENAAL